MPEIGEVARVVSHLKKHLVGKTISKVEAPEDLKLFKNTTAKEFATLMTGKKVVDGMNINTLISLCGHF